MGILFITYTLFEFQCNGLPPRRDAKQRSNVKARLNQTLYKLGHWHLLFVTNDFKIKIKISFLRS